MQTYTAETQIETDRDRHSVRQIQTDALIQDAETAIHGETSTHTDGQRHRDRQRDRRRGTEQSVANRPETMGILVGRRR